jgi:hypothetical protein
LATQLSSQPLADAVKMGLFEDLTHWFCGWKYANSRWVVMFNKKFGVGFRHVK